MSFVARFISLAIMSTRWASEKRAHRSGERPACWAMSERLPFADEGKGEDPESLADPRIGDLHPGVAPRGPDVDQRGEFDAALAAPARVVVRPPEIGLPAALIQKHLLGISVQLPADGDHATLNVGHELDHIAEQAEEAGQIGRHDALLEHEDFLRPHIHGPASYHAVPELSEHMSVRDADRPIVMNAMSARMVCVRIIRISSLLLLFTPAASRAVSHRPASFISADTQCAVVSRRVLGRNVPFRKAPAKSRSFGEFR